MFLDDITQAKPAVKAKKSSSEESSDSEDDAPTANGKVCVSYIAMNVNSLILHETGQGRIKSGCKACREEGRELG